MRRSKHASKQAGLSLLELLVSVLLTSLLIVAAIGLWQVVQSMGSLYETQQQEIARGQFMRSQLALLDRGQTMQFSAGQLIFSYLRSALDAASGQWLETWPAPADAP